MICLHTFWTLRQGSSKSVPPARNRLEAFYRPTPDWMNMSGVNDIRSTFLNYFAQNGHEIVA